MEYVKTKGGFVHLRIKGGADRNTICGAMPKYYNGLGLYQTDEEDVKAKNLHRCKKCFPKK